MIGPVLLLSCGARTDIDVLGATPALAGAPPFDGGKVGDSGPGALDSAPDAYVTVPDGGCKTQASCDDGIPCTVDTCDLTTGDCLHEPQESLCPSGPYCAGDNGCNPQMGCVTTPRNCDDGIACTHDSCDEAMMSCAHVPDDSLCPVGFACDAMLGCVARGFAETDSDLFAVRLPQGTTSLLGATGSTIDDIALHPNGTLYGVGVGGLYTVDPSMGAATLIVAEPVALNALDAAPDGTLYGAGGSTLYTIDPGTGALATVLSYPADYTSSGDLAIMGGTLLATVTNGGTYDDLLAIDLASGSSTIVGTTGFFCVWGLAAYGTTLFGFTCQGEVLGIDPMTGAGTSLTTSPGSRFFGASER